MQDREVPDAGGIAAPPIQLKFALMPKVGFVSHQNAVSVVKELVVGNQGPVKLERLSLALQADPSVVVGQRWLLDALPAQAQVRIDRQDIALNAAFLFGLTESIVSTVTLTLSRQDSDATLARATCRLEVLPANEWGGIDVMPDLLAGFVLPNDVGCARLLRHATELLAQAGRPTPLDGYSAGSRERVWDLTSALWSACHASDLSSAAPPPNYAEHGLRIRLPTQILAEQLANGMDLALWMAGALELAGLNPVVVVAGGRSFAGVWLQPQQFAAPHFDDAESLRKRLALHDLLLFAVDTALGPSVALQTFDGSIALASRLLGKTDQEGATSALVFDIRRARMQNIRPLAIKTSEAKEAATGDGAEAQSSGNLSTSPDLPGFDTIVSGPEPTHAQSRLDRWQRQLLDLTARNRLLNVKPGATAIALTCPLPARLEDELADGHSFQIIGLPDLAGLSGRDRSLYIERTGRSPEEDYAREIFERKEILATRPSQELDGQLVTLYRKARQDLAEGGANTLFLSIGSLMWTSAKSGSSTYRAPLILLPVELERQSVNTGVRLKAHQDEPRFNLTLLEMLRRDFALDIPQLTGSLPTDASGLDVPAIWTCVQQAVRDIPGFEVLPEIFLGTFSFAKYLLWKDLAEHADLLKQSPVVRHLLDTPREPYAGRGSIPRPDVLDREVSPSELFTPLPADSSQLAAVVASARGCDFVLDGPPGTGKSQTIANMVAHNLANGRTVLFVAEKMAALDVVYRRLTAHGLGSFCLQLHSSKANKQDVLQQLGAAWDLTEASPRVAWEEKAEALKHSRDGLNRFVDALHRPYPNGLSIFAAIGRVARDNGAITAPRLNWRPNPLHDGQTLAAMRALIRRLETLRPPADAVQALAEVGRPEWSSAWAAELSQAAHALQKTASEVARLARAFYGQLGVDLGCDEVGLAAAATLADVLAAFTGHDLGFALLPTVSDVMVAARDGLQVVAAFQREADAAEGPRTADAIGALPLQALEAEWAEANGAIWPFSYFRRRAVARRLALPSGEAVARALPALRRLRERLTALDAVAERAGTVPGWAGTTTDAAMVEAVLEEAEQLRSAVRRAARTPDQLAALRDRIGYFIRESRQTLKAGGAVRTCAGGFAAAHGHFVAAVAAFCRVAGSSRLPESADLPAKAQQLAGGVLGGGHHLHMWTRWCHARQEAIDKNLEVFVESIEKQQISTGEAGEAFELAYARWWVEAAIDAEPAVRAFTRVEHVDDIERFCRLDDDVRRLSEMLIRSRLAGELPSKDDPKAPAGYGVLAHQLRLIKRHKPVRQLLGEMGPAIRHLAPCMMMSPLSVAQYLPATAPKFDLVIFDEASQVTPWDAIGTIARGHQLVVAGDPKQLPPTSFFGKGDAVDDQDVDVDVDEESILDACLAARLPQRRLTWHYRSRHESLIAFSNYRYYDGELITFPSPVCEDRAVSWRRVPGEWSRGQQQINPIEAKAIVAEVVDRLRDPAFVDEAGRPLSLAVITLNASQQELVENLLDQARRGQPDLERFFAEDFHEPVIVKNLENIQGDERDMIILGIGFGPTAAGDPHMALNFGPLNRTGGWRRLNVALTRARRKMTLFTSFPPSAIDPSRTRAEAMRDLRLFIEFADRGPRALGEEVLGSKGGFESPFEVAVARGLRARGWHVVPQVGVSRFRIDLGVVHPDRPGDYLAGVECDGATYHSAATARDRDKVREGILVNLGWQLVRVWSTDWWHDSAGALQRIDDALRTLVEASRARDAEVAAQEAQKPRSEQQGAAGASPAQTSVQAETPLDQPAAPAGNAPGQRSEELGGDYRRTSFDTFSGRLQADNFYQPEYTPILAGMVRLVLQEEAPIRDTLLVESIARAHGFKRSGRLIRERVLEVAQKNGHFRQDTDGQMFIWANKASASQPVRARTPASREDFREVDNICLPELRALLLQQTGEDRIGAAARALGISRLTAAVKARLQSAGAPADDTDGRRA